MMTINRNRGFSFIELMISLSISLVVIGGTAIAFSRINEGVRNAARGTDMNNNMRGVVQILQRDLYNAGRGVSDLNVFQIHYNNSQVPNERLFFGLSDVDATAGFSTVTVQWFDYNIIDPVGFPTFPVDVVGGDWGATIADSVFMSTVLNDPAIDSVAVGDLFVIYKSDPFYTLDLRDVSAGVDVNGVYDEVALDNGAFIVQVGSVLGTLDPVATDYPYGVEVSFVGAPAFSNDMTANPVLSPYTDPTETLGVYMTSKSSGPNATALIRYPPGTWLARKLGNATGYHRVTYNVTNGNLIRIENGQPMILASNVTQFDLTVGMDIMAIDEVWTGSVTVTDNTHWVNNLDAINLVPLTAQAMLGRHALAVDFAMSMQSMSDDLVEGGRKVRSMSQLIKLKNHHLPIKSI